MIDKEDKAKIDRMHKLLLEARIFLLARGVYYYSDKRHGPAANLVNQIDEVLDNHDER